MSDTATNPPPNNRYCFIVFWGKTTKTTFHLFRRDTHNHAIYSPIIMSSPYGSRLVGKMYRHFSAYRGGIAIKVYRTGFDIDKAPFGGGFLCAFDDDRLHGFGFRDHADRPARDDFTRAALAEQAWELINDDAMLYPILATEKKRETEAA